MISFIPPSHAIEIVVEATTSLKIEIITVIFDYLKLIKVGERPPKEISLYGRGRFIEAKRAKYIFAGAKEYSVFFRPFIMSSTHILSICLFYHTNNQCFNLLDVGTGDGQFLSFAEKMGCEKNKRVEAYGVSASDMRKNKNIKDDLYIIWNAEEILQHPTLSTKQFHLITALTTFHCFSDSLGTLSQLYRMLAPNGILWVDDIPCYGLQDELSEWISSLIAKGYHIIAGYESIKMTNQGRRCDSGYSRSKLRNPLGWISFLLIQKTHPTLDLGVFYNDRMVFPESKQRKRVTYSFGEPLSDCKLMRLKTIVEANTAKSIPSHELITRCNLICPGERIYPLCHLIQEVQKKNDNCILA